MLKSAKLICFIVIVFLALGCRQEAVEENNYPPIRVETSQNLLNAGEIFSYSVKIKGSFVEPEIKLPCLNDFKVISTQKSEKFFRQEDKVKVEIKINYLLLAPKPGTFTVEPAKIISDEKTYQSQPVEITVKEGVLPEKEKPPFKKDGRLQI